MWRGFRIRAVSRGGTQFSGSASRSPAAGNNGATDCVYERRPQQDGLTVILVAMEKDAGEKQEKHP
jgi:hypothetical protein